MKQCMDSESLHRRLKKIIGQVQAIDRMVDEDVPCEDILSLISAAKSALNKAGRWCSKGTSATASKTVWNTATPTKPLKTSPKP